MTTSQLSATIRRRRGELVAGVLGALAEVEPYASFPPEALTSDIADAIERALRLFVDTLATGELPEGDDLDELGESASRRAEEGVPLDAVVRAYVLGARWILDRLAADAAPEEAPDLLRAAGTALDFLGASTAVVIERYSLEHRLIADARAADDLALLRALLDGTAAPGSAAADSYTVLRTEVGASVDEQRPEVDADIAARRKHRRVRAALQRAAPAALSTSTGANGVALLSGAVARDELDALVEALAQAADAPVWATAVTDVPSSEVPRADQVATELLRLATTLDRPPGLYLLDDLALEHLLSRPGRSRAQLAAAVAPLADRPELADTLRRFLASGMNRRRAALDLGVHPNTVDHRLRRIATLTGLDPTHAAEGFRLNAALIAAEGAGAGDP